jgi:hypothetical protein
MERLGRALAEVGSAPDDLQPLLQGLPPAPAVRLRERDRRDDATGELAAGPTLFGRPQKRDAVGRLSYSRISRTTSAVAACACFCRSWPAPGRRGGITLSDAVTRAEAEVALSVITELVNEAGLDAPFAPWLEETTNVRFSSMLEWNIHVRVAPELEPGDPRFERAVLWMDHINRRAEELGFRPAGGLFFSILVADRTE